MNKSLLTAAILALTAASCQKNVPLESSVVDDVVFTAQTEEYSSGSKTSLDNGSILWKRGDEVSIFKGSTINERYRVSDSSDGMTSAELQPVNSVGFVAGGELETNVAYYPYYADAEVRTNGNLYELSVSLPETQNYADNSFGNGAFPMMAVTEGTDDYNLKFKNVMGCLKLQLKGTAAIKSVTFRGNNNEKLCGPAVVSASNTQMPSIVFVDNAATEVTLDCGTGVQLKEDEATSFVIALPPMTMTGGFTVVVADTENKSMEISSMKSQTITRSNILRMPEVTYLDTIDYSTEPLTIKSIGDTSIYISKSSSKGELSVEYRIDNGSWNTYQMGTTVELSDGETLQFRAGDSQNENTRLHVEGDGKIVVSGNIMSLLDKTLSKDSVPEYSFYRFFHSCKQLIDASNLQLPATTLASYCYDSMFTGCTSLTSAPELPATTLADNCYSEMFSGCTSLTSAPELPATTLAPYCYSSMFSYCHSLTSAPELPATTLASYCYGGMFSGCTSLTSAPEQLPATTLAPHCYSHMFTGCTSLTSAPELPATTLASYCYDSMFYDCTSLTSAPELPATTLASYCYDSMFSGCTSLTSAPELPATTLADNCYSGMFRRCASLTSAPELPATTLASYCYDSMFSGCTSLTSAPELPATTLADNCYSGMFAGCTRLTSAPELPATTLADNCYSRMFSGCENLNYVKALFTTTPSSSYTGSWLYRVSSTGTFVKNSNATWNVSGEDGIPSGWTIVTE